MNLSKETEMESIENKVLSRRNFFRAGLGTAGALVAAKTFAQECVTTPTADQPLGPFFPRAGTPVDPIRENPDQDLPIYLANDNDLTFVKGRKGKAPPAKSARLECACGTRSASCSPT